MQWKKEVKKEKNQRLELFRTKVKHYRRKQGPSYTPLTDSGQDVNRTFVPKYLSEYGDLSIFGPPGLFSKANPPTGPFIGSRDINLSKEEMQILTKDPKYS